MTGDKIARLEALVYCESALVASQGHFCLSDMPEEVQGALGQLKEMRLLDFAKLPVGVVLSDGSTHWVRFTDEGWRQAATVRRWLAEQSTKTLQIDVE